MPHPSGWWKVRESGGARHLPASETAQEKMEGERSPRTSPAPPPLALPGRLEGIRVLMREELASPCGKE